MVIPSHVSVTSHSVSITLHDTHRGFINKPSHATIQVLDAIEQLVQIKTPIIKEFKQNHHVRTPFSKKVRLMQFI